MKSRSGLFAFVAVLALASSIAAEVIDSATINYTNKRVTIFGSIFSPIGKAPAVYIGTTRLALVSFNNVEIIATLPTLAAGSYNLTVVNTSGASYTFDLTYGAAGPQGPVGPQGPIGKTGATGPQGSAGATGQQGPIGLIGPAGPQGPIGPTGAMGATGPQGPIGLTGSAGPQGLTGATGAQGPQGPAGTNGVGFNFQGAYNPSQLYNVNDIVTFGGSSYVSLVGSNQGNEPDTSTTQWTMLAQQGSAGPQGTVGLTGPMGPMGLQGIPGPIGPQGPQGANGTSVTTVTIPAGPNCPTGGVALTSSSGVNYICSGATGAQGQQGVQGPQGFPGTAGATGATGPAGPAGTNGAGFNFTGAWSPTQNYNVNDVATYNGTTYVAVQTGTNEEPDLTSVASNNMNFTVNGAGGAYIWTFSLPTTPTQVVTPVSGTVPNGNQQILAYCQGNGFPLPAPASAGFLIQNVNAYLQSNDGETSSGPLQLNVVFFQPAQASGESMCIVPASGAGIGPDFYGVQVWAGNLQNPTFVAGTYSLPFSSGVQATVTIAPTTNIYWNVMAAAGTPGVGATGPAGPIGPAGASITGPQGPVGATGPQGPAGTNGTGFNFRGVFNTSTAYAVNDVVAYAPAANNITYNVNLTFGSAGSMVGTITTDGTIGVLNTSNIVSWSLTLADSPTNSTLLTPSNSAFNSGNYNTGGQPNSDFTATSTNLTMTYSGGGFWSVSGASGQFCMTDSSNCFGPIAYGTWGINGDNAYSYSGVGGSQVIATGGTVATPVTSTYVATGPVASGTALPGTSPWVMMAQAGSTGAPGATGPQGPVGPSGASIVGPQGPQGPAGPAGSSPFTTSSNLISLPAPNNTTISLLGGYGYNQQGGQIQLSAGSTSSWSGTGTHSDVIIQGGTMDGQPSYASVDVGGGTALTGGVLNSDGGTLTLSGGNAIGSNRNGGNIVLNPGAATGSGNKGNVGIGTANPQATLDVNGNIAVAGTPVINASGQWVGSPVGLQGSIGPQGPAGPQGPIGLAGATGATGLQGPQGATGPQGSAGPQGIPGPVGPQGPAGTSGTGFNWRGLWSSTNSYNVNDVVTFNGTSYVAVQAGTNEQPDINSIPAGASFTETDPIYGTLAWNLPIAPTSQNLPAGEVLTNFGGTSSGGLYSINGVPITVNGSVYSGGVSFLNDGQVNVGYNGGGFAILPNQFVDSLPNSLTFIAGTYPVSNSGLNNQNDSGTLVITFTGTPYWNVVAQSGAPGAAGPQGPAGQQGVMGPQGPQGVQGPSGPTGGQGPAGISTGYMTFVPNTTVTSDMGNYKLASLTLPAGTYMFFGRLTTSNGVQLACSVMTGSTTLDQISIYLYSQPSPAVTSAPLIGTVTIPANGPYDLSTYCAANGIGIAETFTTVPVSSVVVQ